jgi:hypothetical protein
MAALNAASGMNYGQQNANKRLMIVCDAIFAIRQADVSTPGAEASGKMDH